MESRQYWNIKVVYDEIIYNRKEELRIFLDEKNPAWILRLIDCIKDRFECIVVLGWDGTMLHSIQEFCHLDLPFLWINFWTKWFLLNDRNYISANSEFIKKEYPMLDCSVKIKWIENDVVYKKSAFNDIQVKAASWRAVNIGIKIWWHSSVNIIWDWILVSTPAWSTWYNSSAHGPILPHSSPNFIATAILPFNPKNFTPVVYEDKDKVVVTNNAERWRPISVYADWISVIESVWDEMEITIKKSKQKVALLIDRSYEKIWDAKVFQEQWFSLI